MKQVIKYICEFCGNGYTHAIVAMNHEDTCHKNPEVKMCLTCAHAHWNPAARREDDGGLPYDTVPQAACGHPDVSDFDKDQNPYFEPCDCEFYSRSDLTS